MILEITDINFEEKVLKSDLPIVVDFWAEWCGPCKQIASTLELVSKELVNKVKIAKMNIEDNPKIPSELGIRSIPNLILYKEGKIVDTKIGSLSKDVLLEWINSHL